MDLLDKRLLLALIPCCFRWMFMLQRFFGLNIIADRLYIGVYFSIHNDPQVSNRGHSFRETNASSKYLSSLGCIFCSGPPHPD